MTVLERTPLLGRNFLLYLSGLGSTALADALLFIALPFAVLEGEGSKADLAFVVLLGSLPRFFGLFLGVWADRLPARALLIGSGLLRAALVLLVAWAVLERAAPVPLLAGFAFLNGLLVTLTYAAGSALVPRLVLHAQLARANSLTVGATQALPLAGYGLAGLLVKALGVPETLMCAAPLYLVLAVALSLARVPPAERAALERPSFWRDLLESWRVRRSSPTLMYLLLFPFALNFVLNIVNVRAPLFAQSSGAGPGAYALFEGLFSGGALAGILAVGLLARRTPLERQISLGLALFVMGVLALTSSAWGLWWAGSALFGLSVGVLDVAALTLVQQLAPDGMRGRMSGLSLSVGALGLSLGALVAGLSVSTAALMGVLSAVIALLLLGWVVRSRARV